MSLLNVVDKLYKAFFGLLEVGNDRPELIEQIINWEKRILDVRYEIHTIITADKRMFNGKAAKKWMHKELDYFENNYWYCGEINTTYLAEAYAEAKWEEGGDEWLDDPEHEIWDIAAEVAHEFEQNTSSVKSVPLE